jgi:hypothetical protein
MYYDEQLHRTSSIPMFKCHVKKSCQVRMESARVISMPSRAALHMKRMPKSKPKIQNPILKCHQTITTECADRFKNFEMYGRNLTQVMYIDNNYCGHVGEIVIYGSVHIHSWKSETKNEKGVTCKYSICVHTFIHT